MEPLTVGIIGIILLLILILLGVHVAISLGVVGVVGLLCINGFSLTMKAVGSSMFHNASQQSYIVIPMFILMGMIASGTGISENAYKSAQLWIRGIKGGLGIATAAACTLFGTVCGSSLVVAAVFAKMSAPKMREAGYEKKFAYGICSSSGIIGMLIPPSVLFVIYGLITEISIGKLLIAGITPGIIVFIIFSLGIVLMVKFKPSLISGTEQEEEVPFKEKVASLVHLVPVIVAFLIIVGGIFLGIFSPQEAGTVSCVVLIIWFVIYKFPFIKLWEALKDTMSTTAMVFLLIISAAIFSRFLCVSGLSDKLTGYIVNSGFSVVGVFIATIILYLILGCFLDSISMLSITLPVLHPLSVAMGIDPLHYAVVVVMAVEAGLITPPVGLNIYAVKGVAEPDISLEELFMGALPFLLMLVAAIVIFIAFPTLSTWLPEKMF